MANPIRDAVVELLELESDLREEIEFFGGAGKLLLANAFIPAEEKLRKAYTADCKLSLNHEDVKLLAEYLPTYLDAIRLIITEANLDDTWRKTEKPVMAIFNGIAAAEALEFTGHEQLIEQFAIVQQLAHKLLVHISGYYLDSHAFKSTILQPLQELALLDPENLATDFEEFDIEVTGDDWKKEGEPDLILMREHELKTHELKVSLSSYAEAEQMSLRLLEQTFAPVAEGLELLASAALEPTYRKIYQFLYSQVYNVKMPIDEALINSEKMFAAALPGEVKKNFINTLQGFLAANPSSSVSNYLKRITEFDWSKLELFQFQSPRVYELELRELSEYERDYYHSYFSADYFLPAELAGGRQLQIGTSVLTHSAVVYNFVEEAVCGENPNWDYFDDILSS